MKAFSIFSTDTCLYLSFIQLAIFHFDPVLRILTIWIKPLPAATQQVKSDNVHQAHRRSPYWKVSYWAVLGTLLLGGLIRIFVSSTPFWLQQGSILGAMGIMTILPAWWCRGLLRVLLVGQGIVALILVSWPLVFVSPPYTSHLSIFYPFQRKPGWWLLSMLGLYTLYFIITAQWRKPLPLAKSKLMDVS